MEEEYLRQGNTSSSHKFIFKLALEQNMSQTLNNKKREKREEIECGSYTFPVTWNGHCLIRETTEDNETLEMEAHEISSAKPCKESEWFRNQK